MNSVSPPLIGVTSDVDGQGLHPLIQTGEKYLTSVVKGMGAIPVIIPSLPDPLDCEMLLSRLDGILVTGAYANIEPWRYGGAPAGADAHEDPQRDATTFALIPAAVRMGVPLLGICRGFQEMNVIYGGTLHQKLHETGRFIEHREDKSAPLEVQYGDSHAITIEPDGLLARMTDFTRSMVNSVHMQGIDRLGEGLRVEARAPDGLIEAISVIDSPAFAFAVQWHPEFRVGENPLSMDIYQAFNKACVTRFKNKND